MERIRQFYRDAWRLNKERRSNLIVQVANPWRRGWLYRFGLLLVLILALAPVAIVVGVNWLYIVQEWNFARGATFRQGNLSFFDYITSEYVMRRFLQLLGVAAHVFPPIIAAPMVLLFSWHPRSADAEEELLLTHLSRREVTFGGFYWAIRLYILALLPLFLLCGAFDCFGLYRIYQVYFQGGYESYNMYMGRYEISTSPVNLILSDPILLSIVAPAVALYMQATLRRYRWLSAIAVPIACFLAYPTWNYGEQIMMGVWAYVSGARPSPAQLGDPIGLAGAVGFLGTGLFLLIYIPCFLRFLPIKFFQRADWDSFELASWLGNEIAGQRDVPRAAAARWKLFRHLRGHGLRLFRALIPALGIVLVPAAIVHYVGMHAGYTQMRTLSGMLQTGLANAFGPAIALALTGVTALLVMRRVVGANPNGRPPLTSGGLLSIFLIYTPLQVLVPVGLTLVGLVYLIVSSPSRQVLFTISYLPLQICLIILWCVFIQVLYLLEGLSRKAAYLLVALLFCTAMYGMLYGIADWLGVYYGKTWGLYKILLQLTNYAIVPTALLSLPLLLQRIHEKYLYGLPPNTQTFDPPRQELADAA